MTTASEYPFLGRTYIPGPLHGRDRCTVDISAFNAVLVIYVMEAVENIYLTPHAVMPMSAGIPASSWHNAGYIATRSLRNYHGNWLCEMTCVSNRCRPSKWPPRSHGTSRVKRFLDFYVVLVFYNPRKWTRFGCKRMPTQFVSVCLGSPVNNRATSQPITLQCI